MFWNMFSYVGDILLTLVSLIILNAVLCQTTHFDCCHSIEWHCNHFHRYEHPVGALLEAL